MRRIPKILRCSIASLVLSAQMLPANSPFLRKDLPIGDRPSPAVVGDFNGDGRPDLATRSWACALPSGCGSNTPVFSIVSVLLNNGGGNFAQPHDTRVELHVPFFPAFAADVNGDGLLDLLGSDGGNYVHYLPGRGNGTFLPPREIGTGVAAIAGLADFNGDGIPDLLVRRQFGGAPPPQMVLPSFALETLLGNGAGFFQRSSTIDILPENANPNSVRVADFDGDGRTDLLLVTRSESESTLAVRLSLAEGAFRAPAHTSTAAGDLLLTDFNRDGRADIAAVAGILIGNGDGTFQRSRSYPAPGLPVAAADFNGDGMVDVVLSSGAVFSVLPGRGDGTFLTGTRYDVPWPGGADASDFDGDGRADLVTVSDNAVSVFLFRTQSAPQLRRAVSAASGRAIVAPASLATLYAPTGVTATAQAGPETWPTRLGGIRLEIHDSAGITSLAALAFVSPTQINFLVPASTALGQATLTISGDAGIAAVGGMQVDAVAPGLFIAFPPGDYDSFSTALPIPALTGVRVASDGTRAPLPVNVCPRPEGGQCFFPIPLRTTGDAVYLSFYGTGFRGANPVSVTCTINGVPVPVEFAGPQGAPGVDQINVRLRPEVRGQPPIGLGVVALSIDGVVANTAALVFN
jgi:uncharacterized protein (TIGR03437 family)